MEPDEVTVVVHGARGLIGKKPGRCKFSVIFGVGTKKYRTSIVKDQGGSPDWNEESIVHVGNNGDHVFFTMTEKEDVLGQVIIPMSGLTTTQGQVKRVFLKSHKKCPNPQGELIYQCYISKYRPASQTPIIKTSTPNSSGGAQLTGFARLRHSLAASPILPHRAHREKRDSKSSSSLSNFNKKLSKSIHDIFSFGKSSEDDDNSKSHSKFGWKFKSNYDLDANQPPVINAITPKVAPMEGGTQLRITGHHLGIGKSDVIELQLGGCDLLDTLEFESENSLTCVTLPTTPGKGDLWIETISGGQSVVKNVFTFFDTSAKINEEDELGADEDLPVDSGTTSLSVENGHVPLEASIPEQPKSKPPTPMPRSKKEPQYSSNSLPRAMSSDNFEGGRFKKNFMRHVRRSSESAMLREVPERKSWSKSELKEEVDRLQKENQTLKEDYSQLKLENRDQKAYIDTLLAKVLENCPDALESNIPTWK